MKLISMTEFVLKQSIKRSIDNWPVETEDYFNRCEAYANFLKRPLELAIFVPSDLEGNVLEDCGLIPSYELQRYREAKERVLFDGFENVCTRHPTQKQFKLKKTCIANVGDCIETDQYGFYFWNNRNEKERISKIEDLLSFQPLILNHNAITEIGL